jgi:hypothetical protein
MKKVMRFIGITLGVLFVSSVLWIFRPYEKADLRRVEPKLRALETPYREVEAFSLKRAVEPSTLYWFLVSRFHGFIQIGIGIAIGIDCLTTEHTERHGSVSVCLVCGVTAPKGRLHLSPGQAQRRPGWRERGIVA